ncbi:MAG: DUF6642 family protein [Phycisphaerales bacterium]
MAGTPKHMVRPRRPARGVYCIEVEWNGGAVHSQTVRPALELLNEWAEHGVPFIHRIISTRAEFDHHLRRWTQAGLGRYPILYLAVHGRPGWVDIGDWRRKDCEIRLEDVATQLAGACAGKLIHFGSCDTVRVAPAELRRFLRKTGAIAASGYLGSVDWLESAVGDVLALAAMQEHSLTPRGARAMRARMLQRDGLSRALKFRMVVNT